MRVRHNIWNKRVPSIQVDLCNEVYILSGPSLDLYILILESKVRLTLSFPSYLITTDINN